MEGVQVMPAPVMVLPASEAESLVKKAATARGLRPESIRNTGGFALKMTGAGGPERLVWATLDSQDGLLALFSGDRLLAAADKELGEITKVQPLPLPGLPHFAVMVDDRYDQMVGAFAREERRRIYVWDGRGLRQVYQGLLGFEQYRHARWDNPRGPNAWRLRRVLGEVTVRGGDLTEVQRVQQLEAPGASDAPLPPAQSFRLLSEQRQERHLVWNERLRRFAPK
ncbi:MAG TPA: hypothetical protein VNT01_12900 [Symbiobacteriaceae bacterium]|nr:hypothetical protein [Symbiobacteriaceae bacterium]